MEVKQILCAVDFSEDSILAFKAAAKLAGFFHAGLFVIHVIEPTPIPSDMMPVRSLGDEVMSIEQKAMRALEMLIAEHAGRLREGQVSAEVTTGHAATEIVSYVRNLGVDIAVVGAKGVRLLEEAVIGGTTEHVVKEAGCSVLVVKG